MNENVGWQAFYRQYERELRREQMWSITWTITKSLVFMLLGAAVALYMTGKL